MISNSRMAGCRQKEYLCWYKGKKRIDMWKTNCHFIYLLLYYSLIGLWKLKNPTIYCIYPLKLVYHVCQCQVVLVVHKYFYENFRLNWFEKQINIFKKVSLLVSSYNKQPITKNIGENREINWKWPPSPPQKKGTLWLLVDYDNKRSLSLFVAKQYISYGR